MKKLNVFTIGLLICLALSGCNQQIFDTTYRYDRAIISLPDGTVVEGKVSSWKDYEDGDQLQIVIDGVTYLTHATNVCLIAE